MFRSSCGALVVIGTLVYGGCVDAKDRSYNEELGYLSETPSAAVAVEAVVRAGEPVTGTILPQPVGYVIDLEAGSRNAEFALAPVGCTACVEGAGAVLGLFGPLSGDVAKQHTIDVASLRRLGVLETVSSDRTTRNFAVERGSYLVVISGTNFPEGYHGSPALRFMFQLR